MFEAIKLLFAVVILIVSIILTVPLVLIALVSAITVAALWYATIALLE